MKLKIINVARYLPRSNVQIPYLASIFLVFILIFFPIAISDLPPVVDYPNHLARIWILGNLPSHPALASMYEARWWQASTNAAIDFIASKALVLVPLEVVSKVLLGLMFCLPAISALILNNKIFRSYSRWWPIFVILSWNSTAIAGFMSFQIGIGMALLLFFFGYRQKNGPIKIIGDAGKSVVLFLIHPFGWIFFIALRFGEIIGNDGPRINKEYLIPLMIQSTILTVSVVVPAITIILSAAVPPTTQGLGSLNIVWWSGSIAATIYHMFALSASPLVSFSPYIDAGTGVIIAILLIWQAIKRNIAAHFGLLSVSAILLVIGFASPSIIGEGSLLQFRFPVMAYFTAAAAIAPKVSKQRNNSLFLILITLLAITRMSIVLYGTIQNNKDIKNLKSISRYIERASAVLITNDSDDKNHRAVGTFVFGMISSPSLKHAASLLVPWRGSFIPTLFRIPGQHAIGFTEEWDAKGARISDIPTTYQLDAAARGDKAILNKSPYLDKWSEKFKYVLSFDKNPSTIDQFSDQYIKIKTYPNMVLYKSKHLQ